MSAWWGGRACKLGGVSPLGTHCPWSQTSDLQSCQVGIVYYLSHIGCGTLSRQSEQTTVGFHYVFTPCDRWKMATDDLLHPHRDWRIVSTLLSLGWPWGLVRPTECKRSDVLGFLRLGHEKSYSFLPASPGNTFSGRSWLPCIKYIILVWKKTHGLRDLDSGENWLGIVSKCQILRGS